MTSLLATNVLEDADKSEQEKKTYLIGIINKLTTIISITGNKQVNTPASSEHKDDTDANERVKGYGDLS